MNDVTIIIPTRADVEYLKLAVKSIRDKKQYDSVKILIGADTPTPEVREWLENNSKGQYDFVIYEPSEGQSRLGIVNMVEDLVDKVNTKFVYYMHDDMVIGNHTLEKLLAQWSVKKILSSRRVEPPLYPQAPEKIVINLGFTPDEFNTEGFLDIEQQVLEKEPGVTVEGFFAPHFFAKDDWVGYDHLFEPQSREDSDLAQRFVDAGCELITVWDSVVYHFSGKGSRKKDANDDSLEWKKSNYKNSRNYIRKWKTLSHTQFIMPMRPKNIPISAHVLVGDENPEMFFNFLQSIEPWFEEIVLVFDSDKDTEHPLEKVVPVYCDHENKFQPNNFDEEKFIKIRNPLNNDFAQQTNIAIESCSNDWVMKLDVDETFSESLLGNLRFLISGLLEKNPNVSVIGFPRINTLDGKICNDIPREHWFTKEFDQYPEKPEGVQNLDVQYRLHKRFENWVGEVHEVPQSVRDGDVERVVVVQDKYFFHHKSRERQYNQEQKYSGIVRKQLTPIKNIVYDSVIYTVEGITQHAREEVKQLAKKGYNITLLDQNYKSSFGEEFKNFYTPVNFFDMEGKPSDDYVTIVNQAPVRWDKTQHFKNRFGYLAFEGLLPGDWVERINKSNIIELWTPSTYCKEMFLKSGVKKPVEVIPHGVDPAVWKPSEKKFVNKQPFTFLAVGTAHNPRKGFDVLAKAFSEEFGPEEKVQLVYKVNKIYNPGDSFNEYIRPHINWEGNTNIEYYDKNLDEKELVDLFNSCDVYVSPHRCEGFGINILNALAVGTPVVTTGATGNMNFCNEENCLLVDVEDKERWSKYVPPYDRAKWPEPSVASLRQQLRYAYENHADLKEKALVNSEDIRKNWTWDSVTERIRDRIYFRLGR